MLSNITSLDFLEKCSEIENVIKIQALLHLFFVKKASFYNFHAIKH